MGEGLFSRQAIIDAAEETGLTDMETRAPFIIVGAFLLAAVAAVFGFVYWLHNSAGMGARSAYH